MIIVSSEQARELLQDEWAIDRLYNIDYTTHDKSRLALYHVLDLSPKALDEALKQEQQFLFDGELNV